MTSSIDSQATARTPHDSDLGNARRLVAANLGEIRYVHLWKDGGWLVWDGQRLKRDESGEMMRRARSIAQQIFAEADDANDKRADQLRKHAVRSANYNGMKNMIAVARSEEGVPVGPDELDADPWLFNTRTGVVDLRTGEERPTGPEQLITKISPAGYVPGAPCPRWLAFLDRIFDGDPELIEFVRRAIGYTLTGHTTEQVLFLLHGGGANGKTTLVEVIRHIAGDYASQVPAESLMAKSNTGGIPNDIARLVGARFVSAVETDEGRRLAEGLVKRITGNDTLTARFLNAEFFDFTPRFALWLAANHLPTIRGTDDAIWRRIRLIPFNVQIPESERDKHLDDKLKAEADGILTWAIEGAVTWAAEGLTQPAAVVRSTSSYRAEQDTLGDFLDERCHLAEGAWATVGQTFEAYTAWCVANGERTRSNRWLTQQLAARGIGRGQLTTGDRARTYVGLGLLAEEQNT